MAWSSRACGAARLKGERVLVVEDEPLVAMELDAILRDEGAEVVGPASEIEEAVGLANAAPITLALLDVRIGRRSIAPVLRALDLRNIPFVFYSGQTEADDVRREWPDAPFIEKPAPAGQLLQALAACRSADGASMRA